MPKFRLVACIVRFQSPSLAKFSNAVLRVAGLQQGKPQIVMRVRTLWPNLHHLPESVYRAVSVAGMLQQNPQMFFRVAVAGV